MSRPPDLSHIFATHAVLRCPQCSASNLAITSIVMRPDESVIAIRMSCRGCESDDMPLYLRQAADEIQIEWGL